MQPRDEGVCKWRTECATGAVSSCSIAPAEMGHRKCDEEQCAEAHERKAAKSPCRATQLNATT